MSALSRVICGDCGIHITHDAEACTSPTDAIVSAVRIDFAPGSIGLTKRAGMRSEGSS